MRDKSSFHLRSRDVMSAMIATELQRIVRDAARPVSPGDGIQAQMRRAWTVLGRPAWWRVRSAWYGEAGSWSAAAFEDFRHRYAAWCEQQERRAKLQASILADRFEDTARGMDAADSDFYRPDIDGLLDAAGSLRGLDRSGDD